MVDEKYIVDIKGKKFITYAGLLAEAHSKGLRRLSVMELNVNWEKKSAYCIVEAELMTDKEIKIIQGVGSGTPENCSSMVKDHFVEMSQTRAKARALRDILNIDMVSVDELKDVKSDAKPGSFGKDVKVQNKCSQCDADVIDKVKEYSIKNYNKVLCFPCQEKEKNK